MPIDGGSTITDFLNLKLIYEMTITKGSALLAAIRSSNKLKKAKSTTFRANGNTTTSQIVSVA